MKQKIKPLDLLLAAGVLALITFLLFLILNLIFTDKNPEVGTFTIAAQGEEIVPLENVVYTVTDKVKSSETHLKLEDISGSLPEIEYSSSISGNFKDGSKNGPFYFTIYDESLKVYEGKKASLVFPKEPGTYIVQTETYWGTEEYCIGVEYFYKLIVS